jgi:hypothetical protein
MLAAMFLSLSLLTTLEFDIKGFWEIFDPATTLLSQLATVVIRLKRGCQKASFNVALAQRRDTVALGLEQRQ